MSRKPNPPPDDAEQAARFIETAKLLESDETGAAFEAAVRAATAATPPTKDTHVNVRPKKKSNV